MNKKEAIRIISDIETKLELALKLLEPNDNKSKTGKNKAHRKDGSGLRN